MSSGTFKTAVARLFGAQTPSVDSTDGRDALAPFADGWHLPRAVSPSDATAARATGAESVSTPAAAGLTTLGPLGGAAEVSIDSAGWFGAGAASWSIDWAVRDADGWQRPATDKKVTQQLVEPAVVETSLPSGGRWIVHRLAVAVVAGEPVAVIEIENRTPVAVAVAVAVRPFNLTSAGIDVVRSVAQGVTVDDAVALTADTAPRSVHLEANDDAFRLLLGRPDDVPDPTGKPGPVTSTSGAANAALVWPLPHTATLRLSVPLATAPDANAIAPAPADVNRGWQRHLEKSMAIQVDDAELGPATFATQRDVLSRLPSREAAAAWMAAASEAGFAADASRGLMRLDPRFDPGGTIFAIGRTIELGDAASFGRAEALADASADEIDSGFEPLPTWAEEALEPLAIAAHELHRIAKRGGASAAERTPPYLTRGAVHAAANLLRSIDQPDVAERVEQVIDLPVQPPRPGPWDAVQQLRTSASPTWAWSGLGGQPHARSHDLAISAAWLLHVRRLVLDDDQLGTGGRELRILPEIPLPWRGRDISVYRLPIAGASLSYGVRWHGPRPALLWEITPNDAAAPATTEWRLTVPGVSADWSATDLSGEELLPDPGWPETT